MFSAWQQAEAVSLFANTSTIGMTTEKRKLPDSILPSIFCKQTGVLRLFNMNHVALFPGSNKRDFR
ncbi:hypothetical protein [Rhodohalobacter sulfatireducens]|uniref:Uncharacterized protein n=1 Tax=Rhodohalobacter sulfatireducens TaxID=2911366 RepID=A0ABS9K9T7_9BACT|nr:hypothetical protein [Rhodohalobacter sulfatireducens]MCG2587600.1 hypothetical protein [Rhodohalobacter sulfatireducens]